MAEHKEETLDFGTIPTGLRHELAMFLWHRESVAHCGAGIAIQIISVQLSYELQVEGKVPRTDVDIVRQLQGSIVAMPDSQPGQRRTRGEMDDA